MKSGMRKSLRTAGVDAALAQDVVSVCDGIITLGGLVAGGRALTREIIHTELSGVRAVHPEGALVRDGKTGKIKQVKGAQQHHVISDKNPRTKEHPLWDLAGMDPNAPENRILLPTKEGAEGIWTKTERSLHQGRHHDVVSKNLETKMDRVVKQFEYCGGAQKQYAAELKRIIQEERQALISGERILNRHHRPNGVPLPNQKIGQ